MPLSTPPATPVPLSPPREGKVTVTLDTPCGWVCSENEMLFMLDQQFGASIRSCEASFLFFDTQACMKVPPRPNMHAHARDKTPLESTILQYQHGD